MVSLTTCFSFHFVAPILPIQPNISWIIWAWASYVTHLLNTSPGFLSHSPGFRAFWMAGSRIFSSYCGTRPLVQICVTRPRINPLTHTVSESSARQKWNARQNWLKPRWLPCGELGHSSSVQSAVLPLPGPPTSKTPHDPDFPAPDWVPPPGMGGPSLPEPQEVPVFSWRQCWILWKTHSRQ